LNDYRQKGFAMGPGRQDRARRRPASGLEARATTDADFVARWAELTLLISLLTEDPEVRDSAVLIRLSRQLRLCADIPELAAPLLGCDPKVLNPDLLHAAAGLLLNRAPAWRAAS
jgi:hypothetical protein